MSTIDSSTTHHSRPGERQFANKLFIGLAILIVAAILIALVAGQKREMKPAGTAPVGGASSSSPGNSTTPEPISEQPKK